MTRKTAARGGAGDTPGKVGTPAFNAWVTACIGTYMQNPLDSIAIGNMRRVRSALAGFFVSSDEETLKRNFPNDLAKLHLSLAGGALRDVPPGEDEAPLRNRVLAALAGGVAGATSPGNLLAAMLYCRSEDKTAAFLEQQVPDWLYGVYTAFLVMEPMFFSDAASARNYHQFAKRVVRHLSDTIAEGKDHSSRLTPRARIAAHSFAFFSCPVHVYFGDGDLRDMSKHRAWALEQNARAAGLQLDWKPATRPNDRTKIRVGILMPHFATKTETFATLPVFEHLGHDHFEIRLYAIESGGSDLERYCASRADHVTVLSRNPMERASTIRKDNLDILFFGSNLTAGADECTTLALHRLAPLQVASICCPITTDLPNIDYYIAGHLLAPTSEMQPQFREKLVNIPGSGLCFSYGPEPGQPSAAMDRQRLGVPDDAVLFISGANYFKITPDVRQAWATIISRVPGSVLVLYPFNPNWSSHYNHESLVNDIKKRFAQLGLAEQRLKILKPLPNRASIKSLLSIADVYLDSFPYGGATSLVDTLEAGLPPVVTTGAVLRFRQAPSMLQEISIPELIADSEHAYIELACKLGMDPGLRRQLRDKIRTNMATCPPFLDSLGHGSKIASLFRTLHERKTA